MTPSIIIDANLNSADLKFKGSQWTNGSTASYFGGGSYTDCTADPDKRNSTDFPSMTLSYYASAFEVYGQATSDVQLNYTFDDTSSRLWPSVINPSNANKLGVRLWNATFNAGYHSFTLLPSAGKPRLDYVVVTPTSSTTLTAQTLIFDDTDEAILYKGAWNATNSDLNVGIPFGNTRHGSNTIGDTMTIKFVGSTIAVFGLTNQQAGIVTSTYSIDGGPTTSFSPYDGKQESDGTVWEMHQKFFSQDVIPGNHTLTVKVSEVTGAQAFWVDYVLFTGTAQTRLVDPQTSNTSSKSHTALMVGLVIAAIFGFLLFLMIRAKWRAYVNGQKHPSPHPHEQAVPHTESNAQEFPLPQYAPPVPPVQFPTPQGPRYSELASLGPPYQDTSRLNQGHVFTASGSRPHDNFVIPSSFPLPHPQHHPMSNLPPTFLFPDTRRPSPPPIPHVPRAQEISEVEVVAATSLTTARPPPRPQSPEVDAGPAGPPPAYNDANYIP